VPASTKDLESQYFARKDLESNTFDQNGFGQLTYISVGIPMISDGRQWIEINKGHRLYIGREYSQPENKDVLHK
jgi:hypothetical protein